MFAFLKSQSENPAAVSPGILSPLSSSATAGNVRNATVPSARFSRATTIGRSTADQSTDCAMTGNPFSYRARLSTARQAERRHDKKETEPARRWAVESIHQYA